MGLGDLVQKAVYLGIGIASYAGEKANEKLAEMRVQVQQLADDMVDRGEMTADEARKFVDEMLAKAQQQTVSEVPAEQERPTEPRRIEILDTDDPTDQTQSEVDAMRRKVADLQDELSRLKHNP
jgi:polyhydroxyalkanoate synthesis regulator phasin